MVKANDLIKQQKEREDKKYVTFEKIFKHVEKKICTASTMGCYFIWFIVPDMLIGMSSYSREDCQQYIINKLCKNGFEIDFFEPNILLIKWLPK